MLETLVENKTLVRLAILEDLDKVMKLLREFREESLKDYGANLNEQMIRDTVYKYIGSTFVAENGEGVIGVLAGYIINVPTISTPIYQEEVWYSSIRHRSAGIRLLKYLENWCKEKGISHIIMGSLINSNHEKLTNFYIKLGYIPMQIQYIKLLSGGDSDALPQ